ncbi:BMP family lipoprotein [Hutsoniella sourekii]
MEMKKLSSTLLALSLSFTALPVTSFAQEANQAEDFKAVIVTDVGGIDDKSFNQGAWEGLVAWGQEHNKEEGEGYNYLHSQSDSDYVTNLTTAAQSDFDIVFAIGYKLQPSLEQVAKQFPNQNFAIVDGLIEAENVASLNFNDEEAAFLAGVAAANSTDKDKIGFIGGVEGVVIDKFEAGFMAGVQAVAPDKEVVVEYAGSFVDPTKGRTLASTMYAQGIDLIFHASGPTGNGVFAEAKDLITADPSRQLWVIGVDRDQTDEGAFKVNGEDRNVTLTSTLKNTGNVVRNFANQMMAEGFQSGNIQSNLANDGVGLANGQLDQETLKLVAEYKEKIISGEITVPDKPGQ